MSLHTADTPSLRIQYHEYGAGTPVILLHGFPDAPIGYEPVLDLLKDEAKTHRFLVPYLRGFGQTEVLQPNLVAGQQAALAHDLLGFADALNLDSFHLVGHDWGARTAYAAAILAPERIRTVLALATPYLMYGGDDYPPAQVRAHWYQWYLQLEQGRKILHENAEAFCRELWESWSPTWGFSRRDFTQAAEAWKNPQFAEIVLHAYRTRWGGALGVPAYAALQSQLDTQPKPKIATPTIFVQGAADACNLEDSSEAQHDHFTGPYERVVLKGVGHFPHREDPKAVAKLLKRQLTS